MSKPFFYIIPRTSSTSLTSYLQTCFGPDKVFVRKVVEDIYDGRPVTSSTPTPSMLQLKFDLAKHFEYQAFVVMAPFGVHRFIDDELDLFVTLRDPVERCLSLIRFMRAKPTLNSTNSLAAEFGEDFGGMLAKKELICLRNEQTRMLGDFDEWVTNEDSLAVAQNNLHYFSAVLDFRDYGQRIRQIIKKYGVDPPVDYPMMNASPRDVTFDRTQTNLLRKVNELDLRLYKNATKESAYAFG